MSKKQRMLRRSEFEDFLRGLRAEATFDGTCFLVKTATGAYEIEPPFMPKELIFPPRSTILQELLASKPRIAVVLVRMGEYALGLFEGTELLNYKTGSHFIRGRTRRGGSSAGRYQRIRVKQREEFLEKVCANVVGFFDFRAVDYIFLGGSGDATKLLVKTCALLEGNKNKIVQRTLTTRHADLETLRKSIEDVWSFRVSEF